MEMGEPKYSQSDKNQEISWNYDEEKVADACAEPAPEQIQIPFVEPTLKKKRNSKKLPFSSKNNSTNRNLSLLRKFSKIQRKASRRKIKRRARMKKNPCGEGTSLCTVVEDEGGSDSSFKSHSKKSYIESKNGQVHSRKVKILVDKSDMVNAKKLKIQDQSSESTTESDSENSVMEDEAASIQSRNKTIHLDTSHEENNLSLRKAGGNTGDLKIRPQDKLSANMLPNSKPTELEHDYHSISSDSSSNELLEKKDENNTNEPKSTDDEDDEVVIINEIFVNKGGQDDHSLSDDATNQNKADDDSEVIFISESGGNRTEDFISINTNNNNRKKIGRRYEKLSFRANASKADKVSWGISNDKNKHPFGNYRGWNRYKSDQKRNYHNCTYNGRYTTRQPERYKSHHHRDDRFRRDRTTRSKENRVNFTCNVNPWVTSERSVSKPNCSFEKMTNDQDGEVNSSGATVVNPFHTKDVNSSNDGDVNSSSARGDYITNACDVNLSDSRDVSLQVNRSDDTTVRREINLLVRSDVNWNGSREVNLLDGQDVDLGTRKDVTPNGSDGNLMIGEDVNLTEDQDDLEVQRHVYFSDDKSDDSVISRHIKSRGVRMLDWNNLNTSRANFRSYRKLPYSSKETNRNELGARRRSADEINDKKKGASTLQNISGAKPSYNTGLNIYIPFLEKERKGFRPIIIDGPNVAYGHGHDTFSFTGLTLCLAFFLQNNHKDILIVLPQRLRHYYGITPTEEELMKEMIKENKMCIVPNKKLNDGTYGEPYDDRYVVQIATMVGGVIISNDRYEDIVGESEEFRETIRNRCIPFTFANNMFILPTDPFGKKGPKLDEIMKFPE